ncbi:MAG: hypothetical protein CVT61_01925 [Actinobacteria bacterium HGW-Actinobacteria-11]|nr:MAG: hypothetical protein CVT61_01925 [Actinobacteria bacterium HGW-Actinobacteria-11]
MMTSASVGRGLPRPIGRQREVVYLASDRDQVVLGTAGSGKTTMAILRAAYLANSMLEHSGRTLLVTYNKALRGYLQHLSGPTGGSLDIQTYHAVARGYLHGLGRMGTGSVIVDGARRTTIISDAIASVRAHAKNTDMFDRPRSFFDDEFDWISGHGFTSLEDYLDAERRGRATPLQAGQRKQVWRVREEYHNRRAAAGYLYDWWDLPGAVLDGLREDERERRFRHVVVDEAQDLPPQAIRSLKQLLGPGGTMTLFADYAQQLYGYRTSYVSCGLRIRKAELFQENYRNSPGIARLAIATAALPHFRDRADLVEPRSPAAEGLAPTLFRAESDREELAAIRAQAAQLAQTGTVAILTRTRAEARAVAGALRYTQLHEESTWSDRNGLYVGTYYSAKGLEFDAVILPGVGSTAFPDAEQIDAFGKPEAGERDARLLYVGITRARAELLVTYQGELTSLLPPPNSGYWTLQGAHADE